MTVLVISLDGQIRNALEAQLSDRNRLFESVGGEWFDVDSSTGAPRLAPKIGNEITMVVNAISLECLEQRTDEGLVDSVVLLAKACALAAVPLIHLSSCQVFDGLDGEDHSEDVEGFPSSRIGVLLGRMETLIREICTQAIILRVGPLFSSVGDNLLTQLITRFQTGETLSLSTTDNSCLMHSCDLARVISAIIDQLSCDAEPWGTYHYCSPDPASSCFFAETVLAMIRQHSLTDELLVKLKPNKTKNTPWSRPTLNCGKILSIFGIKQLTWRAFVLTTLKEILQPEKSNEVGKGGKPQVQ